MFSSTTKLFIGIIVIIFCFKIIELIIDTYHLHKQQKFRKAHPQYNDFLDQYYDLCKKRNYSLISKYITEINNYKQQLQNYPKESSIYNALESELEKLKSDLEKTTIEIHDINKQIHALVLQNKDYGKKLKHKYVNEYDNWLIIWNTHKNEPKILDIVRNIENEM